MITKTRLPLATSAMHRCICRTRTQLLQLRQSIRFSCLLCKRDSRKKIIRNLPRKFKPQSYALPPQPIAEFTYATERIPMQMSFKRKGKGTRVKVLDTSLSHEPITKHVIKSYKKFYSKSRKSI